MFYVLLIGSFKARFRYEFSTQTQLDLLIFDSLEYGWRSLDVVF